MFKFEIRHIIGYFFLTSILLCLNTTISAQEIVNALVIESNKTDPETGLRSQFNRADDLIDDHGRLYMKIDKCDKNFHIVHDDIIDIYPINTYVFTSISSEKSPVLREYTLGEGITDHTIFNYCGILPEIVIDGDIVAASFSAHALSLDNKIYEGDTTKKKQGLDT